MKKLLCCLLSMAVIFGLAGCVGSDVPIKEQGGSTVSTQGKNEEFGLNETAVFSDLKFTATELKETDGDGLFVPAEGNVFVGIKFTVENISQEDQTVSTLLLFEAYSDDVKCAYSFGALTAFSEGTLDGTIAPGKKLVGWYALEVPKNWSTIELDVQSTWLSNNQAKFVFTK